MEAFLISTGIVALAEMGDKTQLLSLLLAARFRRHVPIILGILVATLLNHAGAGTLGNWLTALLGQNMLRQLLGVSFLVMAVWTLIPDKPGEFDTGPARLGVFGATLVAFFLAEMGDKTQVATVALAAKYSAFGAVVLGTTLGMMLANVPAVLLGNRLIQAVSLKLVRTLAAAVFTVLGLATLLNAGGRAGIF